MKRLIPKSIVTRTLLVLIIGLAVSHAISIALYATDRSSSLVSIDGRHIGDRIAVIDRLIRGSPEQDRQRMVSIVSDDEFSVTRTANSVIGADEEKNARSEAVRIALGGHLDADLSRNVRVRDMSAAPENRGIFSSQSDLSVMVSLSLPDQSWLNFVVPLQTPRPLWTIRFGLSLAIMLVAITILSALVVHQLTRPLAELARASDRLGKNIKSPPLPETGPIEIRQATEAFNQMHRRILRFVEDRTQMIAAISHDLGTPIARMRLRAEFVDDEEQRNKMLADLLDMEKMVSDTLSFVRDEATREPLVKVEFRAMLQRVCDDIADTGFKVSLTIDAEFVPYECRPAAMRRALGNLVENAAKYGNEARVSLSKKSGMITLTIDDNGPGIPNDRQDDVFKPFFRLEGSRSRETGGTGLGMTVARSIIRAHGGDIYLGNRKEGGLRMQVILPTS